MGRTRTGPQKFDGLRNFRIPRRKLRAPTIAATCQMNGVWLVRFPASSVADPADPAHQRVEAPRSGTGFGTGFAARPSAQLADRHRM